MIKSNSRRQLCMVLSLIMAIGICLYVFSTLFRLTICTPQYMSVFTESGSVRSYCDNAYDERIALLAENSGIPVRVFDIDEELESYSETATQSFYAGSDKEYLRQSKIDMYERLIKEYLDGNDISYDDKQIYNTAVKAAEINADCYEVKDTGTFKAFTDNVKASYNKLSSAGLAIALFAVSLILVLHNNKKKTTKYYLCAFTATGASIVIISLICLIFGVGHGAVITPDVYGKAIFRAIDFMYVILIFIGVIITAISSYFSLKLNKLIKENKHI